MKTNTSPLVGRGSPASLSRLSRGPVDRGHRTRNLATRNLLRSRLLGLGLIALFAVLAVIAASVAASPGTSRAEVAQSEYDEVMRLDANLDNGRRVYLACAVCHLPEGWGSLDGSYPQIAGQLRTVIIKQLADFRAGNRDNPLMYPFSVPSIIGGAQEIADVAAYVAQLPMSPHNAVGPGNRLALGEQLYVDNCADCHGAAGEGDLGEHIPAIAGQHWPYLMRQFDQIRGGQRKNADPKMREQIEGFTAEQQAAVLDYSSRLRPPARKLADDGWLNPDFPDYARDAMVIRAYSARVQHKFGRCGSPGKGPRQRGE